MEWCHCYEAEKRSTIEAVSNIGLALLKILLGSIHPASNFWMAICCDNHGKTFLETAASATCHMF